MQTENFGRERPHMSRSITARHLAVVGSGHLARSICYSLAETHTPIRVSVLARNGAAVEEIVRGCRTRTRDAWFTGEVLEDTGEAVARLRPDVLVCVASAQSPYEKRSAPSAWTTLIERAGFGITLPFQAAIVSRLAGAIAATSPNTLLINGCFPDAVNPLLATLGLPVHCGIGNVATLAACLRAESRLPNLAVLGHHAHLSEPGDDDVLAWSDGHPVADVTRRLATARALPRPELNTIAAHAAAQLLIDLLAGKEIHTSLPGPLGLPGGYPVRLRGSSIELNLPPGLGRAEAVAWNTRAGLRDGVEISSGWVRYPERAAAELDRLLPGLAGGWPVTALDEVSATFEALRQRLRLTQPVQV